MFPRASNIDKDKISSLYADLRRESSAPGSVPMTVRHLESIIRMAEANARMHLREQVREDDINLAIRVLLDTFISAQKLSVARAMRASFRKYITYKKDHNELLLHVSFSR